jgi:hypothetical protein
MKKRVLFICKDRDISYFGGAGSINSSGLYNSASAVCEMLNKYDFADAKIVKVVDNNCIDKEVYGFRPTHVMIEALWVVPEKFDVLKKLHPEVKWYVRLHSDTSFLANEGMAVDWMFRYSKREDVYVAFNSVFPIQDFRNMLGKEKMVYLPNYYETVDSFHPRKKLINNLFFNIGCFGAIRPFKNQLLQATSAMRFADNHGKYLRFYINSTRVENKGGPILDNLRSLFRNSVDHQLIEIDWLEHDEFIEFLRKEIDIGMQVSLTETYNVVTADLVNCCIPIVVSPEVYWVARKFQADPNLGSDIIEKLNSAYRAVHDGSHKMNNSLLEEDSSISAGIWKDFLKVQRKRNWWDRWR